MFRAGTVATFIPSFHHPLHSSLYCFFRRGLDTGLLLTYSTSPELHESINIGSRDCREAIGDMVVNLRPPGIFEHKVRHCTSPLSLHLPLQLLLHCTVSQSNTILHFILMPNSLHPLFVFPPLHLFPLFFLSILSLLTLLTQSPPPLSYLPHTHLFHPSSFPPVVKL